MSGTKTQNVIVFLFGGLLIVSCGLTCFCFGLSGKQSKSSERHQVVETKASSASNLNKEEAMDDYYAPIRLDLEERVKEDRWVQDCELKDNVLYVDMTSSFVNV